MISIFIILAVLIGILMPMQAGLNAQLAQYLKHPFLSTFVSLATGSVLVFLLLIINGSFSEIKKITDAPPHLFLGGILGVIFVGSSLYLIPKLGATALISAFITGQLIGSVVIDHFGLFGLSTYAFNPQRLLGIILLFMGLFLVIKRAT